MTKRRTPSELLADPVWLRKFHGWATIFWVANLPPVLALYLVLDSKAFQAFCLLYLALVSIWANVAGHWASWQASRIEVKEDERSA